MPYIEDAFRDNSAQPNYYGARFNIMVVVTLHEKLMGLNVKFFLERSKASFKALNGEVAAAGLAVKAEEVRSPNGCDENASCRHSDSR